MSNIPPPNTSPQTLLALYKLHTAGLYKAQGVTEDGGGGYAAIRWPPESDVYNAVMTDKDERRRVISLVLKGYTYRQIGAALGMCHGEVGSHVARGMKRAWRMVTGVKRQGKKAA